MTKIEFIELIKHRLEGEARAKNLGKFHPTVISHMIGKAYNSLVVEAYARNMTDFDPYTKTYTGVAIALDVTTGVYYSTLPAAIVQLQRSGSGVMRIIDTDSSLEFVPINNGELQAIPDLELNLIDDVVGYVYKNHRVEYLGLSATDTVNMELVIPFEDYDETDIVQLPTGSDQRIVEMVVNMMIGTPDSDNLNNNNTLNPNIRR